MGGRGGGGGRREALAADEVIDVVEVDCIFSSTCSSSFNGSGEFRRSVNARFNFQTVPSSSCSSVSPVGLVVCDGQRCRMIL